MRCRTFALYCFVLPCIALGFNIRERGVVNYFEQGMGGGGLEGLSGFFS